MTLTHIWQIRFNKSFLLNMAFISSSEMENILREKSLAIHFEDSQFRRNRTFNFILSNIYDNKRSQIR